MVEKSRLECNLVSSAPTRSLPKSSSVSVSPSLGVPSHVVNVQILFAWKALVDD